MPDVQFNEPEYGAAPVGLASRKTGPIMGFIIAQKWAKDEAGAQRILLYVVIVVVAITAMIVVPQIRFSNSAPILPAEPTVGTP